ncbi:acetylneuraminic acid synthetase [Pseudoclavibacter sp. CFCC 11306]|nr:acetylneuraminic acid synthetase [Pseudoclavibacter sp. CFCC 11306]
MDPYVIAEIGVNHEGSLARALKMIDSVASAGGHAAKFQTYKAATLASRDSSPAYWDTTKEATPSQFELFSRYDSFGVAEYEILAEHCAEVGIDFLSTPFDLPSVSMLAPYMPAFKIASADLTNVPLVREIGAQGKPVIMSIGASTFDEIDRAMGVLTSAGATQIGLLHCVLRYPTPPADANLLVISSLLERYGQDATVGYSDHVAPNEDGDVPSLLLASSLGARIIEKHFTDDRSAVGNDHYHAFDESGLRRFTRELAQRRELAGSPTPDTLSQRTAIQNARRRICVAQDLRSGTVLLESDLIPLRANQGIEVAEWDQIVGRSLRVPKTKYDVLLISDLE